MNITNKGDTTMQHTKISEFTGKEKKFSSKNTYLQDTIKKLMFIFFGLCVFIACDDNKMLTNATIITEKYRSPICFSEIKFADGVNMSMVKGISIDCKLFLPKGKKSFKKYFGEDCIGYDIEVRVLDTTGRNIAERRSTVDTINPIKDFYSFHVSSYDANKSFELFIPYANLKLPAGKHVIRVEIMTYPVIEVRQMQQSEQNYSYNQYSKRGKVDITMLLQYNIEMPIIKTTRIGVLGFEFNTQVKDPSTYDVRFLGPGYPDLYWTLYYDDNQVFYSNYITNELIYNEYHITPELKYIDGDKFLLKIYDNDGFNQNDLVSTVFIDPKELSRDSLHPTVKHFDKIKNLQLFAK